MAQKWHYWLGKKRQEKWLGKKDQSGSARRDKKEQMWLSSKQAGNAIRQFDKFRALGRERSRNVARSEFELSGYFCINERQP